MKTVLCFNVEVCTDDGGVCGATERIPATEVRSIFQTKQRTLISLLDGRDLRIVGVRKEIRFEQEAQ